MARTVVNVTASSTLDGRDISADGTKLDGIEANATADQTAAEIKSLVEASSDIALAGNPTTTTQSSGNNSTRIATTAFVADATSGLATDSNLNSKAPIASPTFTGVPAAPTASSGTNTTQIATTAFVTTAVAGATIDGISSSADATAITIDSSERVGVGTTSPTSNLHVNSAGNTIAKISSTFNNSTTTGLYIDTAGDSSQARLLFSKSGTTRGLIAYSHNASANSEAITFGTAGGSERMRITGSGVVGIGTSSPVGILHLQSDDNGMVFQSSSSSNSRTQIFFQNNGGTQRAKIAIDPDGGNANVMAFSTGSSERMRIDASGNVGIGTTSPSGIFHSKVGSGGSGTLGQAVFGYLGGSTHYLDANTIIFRNGSEAESMRINSSGNLGIGTTSPGAALDVVGTIKVSTGSDNVGVGGLALAALTSGSDNVGVGYNVLNDLTTGTQNTAMGHAALDNLTTGAYNVAIGAISLTALTTASYNTSLGRTNLYSCTTGDANTSAGYYGMFANTTGTYNTSQGTSSLQNNTTGSYNTGLGSSALLYCTTGTHNTGVGFQALLTQTTANHNVGIGYAAGYNATTGAANVFIGNFSGHAHTTGSYSTYAGYQAGYSNTTGLYNTYLGGFAGYTASTASYSVCLGYYSGFALTTSGYHAMLGYYAGSNTTGSAYGNVCVGYNAQAGGTTNAAGNQRHTSIVLGYNTLGVGSGYFTFGTGTGNDRVYNQFGANASWTRVSDQRYKKDIQNNTDCGLAFINDLRPVTFKWKAKSEIDSSLPDYDANKTEAEYSPKMYGLIAQEVKQVLDNHNITDFGGWHQDETSGIQGISQEMFIYPLIKAVQELSAKVTALENGG